MAVRLSVAGGVRILLDERRVGGAELLGQCIHRWDAAISRWRILPSPAPVAGVCAARAVNLHVCLRCPSLNDALWCWEGVHRDDEHLKSGVERWQDVAV